MKFESGRTRRGDRNSGRSRRQVERREFWRREFWRRDYGGCQSWLRAIALGLAALGLAIALGLGVGDGAVADPPGAASQSLPAPAAETPVKARVTDPVAEQQPFAPRPESANGDRARRRSSYALMGEADFTNSDAYPVRQFPGPNFRPAGDWVGRLLLPTEAQRAERATGDALADDWVWFQVYVAPPEAGPDWVGRTVRLVWTENDRLRDYVRAVQADVSLSEGARRAWQNGTVVPLRLDGRAGVGPLESLAGARPEDDVIVRLDSVAAIAGAEAGPDGWRLETRWEPVQVAERFYGLVQILGPDPDSPADPPIPCPGDESCPTEIFRARHFNAATRQFDGPELRLRIPQPPRDRAGRFPSTIRDLADAPAGRAGWYVYGARDAAGTFTVRALMPRSLVQLQPDLTLLNRQAGFDYLKRENWRNTPARKGQISRVLMDPTAGSDAAALDRWQEGDLALAIHLFGGIGGEQGERVFGGTVTGHFAYGLATVRQEPLADELQFAIDYQQIYANSTVGIVAGSTAWSEYMGNLTRGWAATRPVSDVLVKTDLLEPYAFGNDALAPLAELLVQAQVLAARYRTGDGTGIAQVTPATSCVQDSNQALFLAIARLRQHVAQAEPLQAWLQANPDSSAADRLGRLRDLERDLLALLVPRGTVRPDWRQNAEFVAGVDGTSGFARASSAADGFLSWRSILPRQSHDEVAAVFLDNDAALWVLRTNQVGGEDPEIFPIAATTALGRWPPLNTLLDRLLFALGTRAEFGGIVTAIALLLLGAIALPYGLISGFFEVRGPGLGVWPALGTAALLFLRPAAIEELVFRVLLLPHPVERMAPAVWLAFAAISLALYLLYHPLLAWAVYPPGRGIFSDRRFLILTGLLGLLCTAAYGLVGAWWVPTVVHWVAVCVWVLGLGGRAKLTTTAGKER